MIGGYGRTTLAGPEHMAAGFRQDVLRAICWLTGVAMWLMAPLINGACSIAATPPRSMLVLNESAMVGPFYYTAYNALRSAVTAKSSQSVSIYLEQLELERFGGERYEMARKAYFQSKYDDKPIGVIVAVGFAALDLVLRLRKEMWSDVPIVFVMADDDALQRLNIPPDVTGRTANLKLRDSVSVARAVVQNLERIAIVGDRWEIQTAYRHFKDQIPVQMGGLELIDLIGLPMRELRKRVAVLPDRTAIVYTSIFSDGEGTSYPPADALGLVAEVANRPIVVSAETFVGRGGIGGYVLTPTAVGREAGELALRILNGESASGIPINDGNVVKPIFDWRELKRWDVSESQLPLGSEVRFRELTVWQQYRVPITVALAAIFLQSAIIWGLLIERHRRQAAEKLSRDRLADIVRLNQIATVEAMSSSIAHELKQPISAILNNAEAAQLLLSADPPDIAEARETISDILTADRRADEIITHLRQLMKKKPEIEYKVFDVNEVAESARHILSLDANKKSVLLDAEPASGPLPVRADPVHIRQVLLNLGVNAIDAMMSCPPDKRRLVIRTTSLGQSEALVSVLDTGPGFPEDLIQNLFDPFVTTKDQGTGLGLSIARTIIETYGGKIWAENRPEGGAAFRFTLGLARAA